MGGRRDPRLRVTPSQTLVQSPLGGLLCSKRLLATCVRSDQLPGPRQAISHSLPIQTFANYSIITFNVSFSVLHFDFQYYITIHLTFYLPWHQLMLGDLASQRGR